MFKSSLAFTRFTALLLLLLGLNSVTAFAQDSTAHRIYYTYDKGSFAEIRVVNLTSSGDLDGEPSAAPVAVAASPVWAMDVLLQAKKKPLLLYGTPKTLRLIELGETIDKNGNWSWSLGDWTPQSVALVGPNRAFLAVIDSKGDTELRLATWADDKTGFQYSIIKPTIDGEEISVRFAAARPELGNGETVFVTSLDDVYRVSMSGGEAVATTLVQKFPVPALKQPKLLGSSLFARLIRRPRTWLLGSISSHEWILIFPTSRMESFSPV